MPQSVLVVDDSPEVHRLLEARLQPEGLAILHAFEPQSGFEQALDVQPDLVLLDLDLGGVSGFELCQRLKDDARTAHIPVIILTGASQVDVKVKGFDLGAVDFVTKPFDAAELRARVRSALRTKRFLDLLATRSNVDGLTGVWNRAYFDRRLRDEIEASRRYGRIVSLVMFDIDHFKTVNDGYGHPFGDRVLESIGQLMLQVLRATDVACRYGGEEFAVVLSETDQPSGFTTAERLRLSISALQFRHEDQVVKVTASLGVSCSTRFNASNLSAAAMVLAADGALYRAKQGGRDQTCVAGAVSGEPAADVSTLHEVRRARRAR
jgi:diguanylate cyclase (GGDEF)-like protein